jgi:hypothetical protein
VGEQERGLMVDQAAIVGDWAGCENMSVMEADLVAKGMDPFMTDADSRIYDLKTEAVELAKRAAETDFKADHDRVAAGLKFIELRAAVQAEGHGWEAWFPKHVHGVSLRTAQRYMALTLAPERAPAIATEEQPGQGENDTLASPAEAKETLKKASEGSPRRRLATIVAKLSESEAGELLMVVEKWRAKRA